VGHSRTPPGLWLIPSSKFSSFLTEGVNFLIIEAGGAG
jgi:hypothetical protein